MKEVFKVFAYYKQYKLYTKSKINFFQIIFDFIFENKLILLIIFIISLALYMFSYINYYIFHNITEFFSCIIGAAIFLISINTYKINKNNFFVILGIGYFFTSILDILHAFSFGDLIIFANETYDIDTKLWIAARIFEVTALFFSTYILNMNNLKPNYFIVISVYLAIFAFLIIDINYFHFFIPTLRTKEFGITKYKIIIEYIIIIVLIISLLNIYKLRKIIDNNMFLFLTISIFLKILSELCFTVYSNVTDIYLSIGHLLKLCSFYFIYIGIVENGILKPFDLLNNDLYKADNHLKENEKQRKYLEEIIVQNEKCYNIIIDNSCNGIIIIEETTLIYANSTAAKMFGANHCLDLIGKEIWDFLIYEPSNESIQKEKILNNFTNKIDKSVFFELSIKKLDGKNIDLKYSISNITYRGKHAYLVILKDISHEKEIKSLTNDLYKSEDKLCESYEYNRILTEFFCTISHELKTPLNIILGSLQLLQNNKSAHVTIEKEKLFEIMKQNTFRLIKLSDNLIDISKYDSGYLKLNKHNYNIVSIVEDITLSVSDYYKLKNIKLIFDTDIEEKIMAIDEDKIERIMLNLLSNAVKFTENGGNIFVNFEDKGNYVQISVKDSGIGIPIEKIETIFDRFEQVDKSLTRKREGSGIGLSIVKTLVELHGGNINVISKLGVGSEFIFKLPVAVINEKIVDKSTSYESKIDKISIEFSDIYN